MTTRISRLIGSVLFLVAGFVSLPGLAHAAGGTSVRPPAAASPVQAVRALLHSYVYTPSGHPGMVVAQAFRGCEPTQGRLKACPLTARLQNRLRHPDPITNGCLGSCTLDPFSRAQNTTVRIAITVASNNGRRAVVNTRWTFYRGKWALTYTVVRNALGWQVDDSYCTGHPDTTIYRVPVGPCPGM